MLVAVEPARPPVVTGPFETGWKQWVALRAKLWGSGTWAVEPGKLLMWAVPWPWDWPQDCSTTFVASEQIEWASAGVTARELVLVLLPE
jgi:hypothetical protein